MLSLPVGASIHQALAHGDLARVQLVFFFLFFLPMLSQNGWAPRKERGSHASSDFPATSFSFWSTREVHPEV